MNGVVEALLDLFGDLAAFAIVALVPVILAGVFVRPILKLVPGTEKLQTLVGLATSLARRFTLIVILCAFGLAMLALAWQSRQMSSASP
jgi:hypothetical protein